MQLLRIMKRKAEDVLLGDASNVQGKAALIFLKNVIKEKRGVRVNVLKKGITSAFNVLVSNVSLNMFANCKKDFR